jgi:hypothetical protein
MFVKVIVSVIAFLVCANAFHMGSRSARTSSLKMAGEMVGASIEVNGGKVYDPLGLLDIHEINPGVLPHGKWLREAELKHSRIAMLASIGAFASQWGLTLPGYTAVPDPVGNLNQFVANYPFGFAQIILTIGLIEGNAFPGEFWFGKGDRDAGDLGYDPLGYQKKQTQAQKDDMRLKELKNGRLAMIAMAAYTSEHWIPGSVPFLPGSF